MGKIEKKLEGMISELPRRLVRKKLKKKLRAEGVTDNDAIEAFVDHVMSNKDVSFVWDDGEVGPPRQINISFTEEDQNEILEALERFNEDLPDVFDTALQKTAKSIAKRLNDDWKWLKIDYKHERAHFKDRLDQRWKKGLDPLRMMLVAARELGQDYADRLGRSKAKKGIETRIAISALHIRACQTTLEILTLIENGLPDGAYARWRTLYELNVVAYFIHQAGDDVASRYFAHDVVSMRTNLANDFRFYGETFDRDKLDEEGKELEDEYNALIAKFGKPFASPYGWAAEYLDLKKPIFQDLEKAVDWGALPPEYKMSSFKVHAGVAGTFRTLSTVGGPGHMIAGASNYGMDRPAILTAQSLLRITVLVFETPLDIELAAQMQSLALLRDRVAKHCNRIAEEIESEELAKFEESEGDYGPGESGP